MEEEALVAAIPGRSGQSGGRKFGNNKPQFKRPTAQAASSGHNPSPQYLAQNSAGLCFYHWTFGDRASKCKSPCSWQGN